MTSDADNAPTVSRETASEDGDDRALLARVRSGDRTALKHLYVKYYSKLLRFVVRIVGEAETAQECINDTMLVVWSRSDSFEGRSTVATWIMGIAYRTALKLRREARRRTRRRIDVGDFEEWVEHSAGSGQLMDDAELEDLLARALRKLPPEQRAVVELTYFYGFSYLEIAEIVSCPVNTVKTRMFHARRKLQPLLRRLG